MASGTAHTSVDSINTLQVMTIHGDTQEENSTLSTTAGTRHTSHHSSAAYGSIQNGRNDEETLLKSINNLEQSISRARQARQAKAFPYIRARVTALAIISCYMVTASSMSPLETQYFHYRFASDLFHNSTASHSIGSQVFSNCNGTSSSHFAQKELALQKHVAKFRMYLSYAGLGPIMVTTVMFGSLSDTVGRRILFLSPCMFMFVKQLIRLFAMGLDLPLWVFYVANIVDGLSGSFSTLFLAICAYTADITPASKERTFGITLLEAVMALSAFGQLALGYVIQDYGFFYGSLIPTAFAGFAVVIGLFFLPETISRSAPSNTRLNFVNPFKYLKNVFGFYIFEGNFKQRFLFCLTLMILFIIFTCSTSYLGLFTLFQLNLPFCWSPAQVGLYEAMTKVGSAIASLVAVPLLQKRLSDSSLVAVGLSSLFALFVLSGMASNDLMIYLVPLAGGLGGLTQPACRSILSKMASANKQGALFASIAVIETAGSLASSSLYNSVYEATVAHMKGAVFLIVAGIVLADLGPVLILRCLLGPAPDDQNNKGIGTYSGEE